MKEHASADNRYRLVLEAFDGARWSSPAGCGLIGSALARRLVGARRRGAAGRQHGARGRRQPRQHRRYRASRVRVNIADIRDSRGDARICSTGAISCSTWPARPAISIR